MKTLAMEIIERLAMAGKTSPGATNLAADIVGMAANRAAEWTHRADDAERIPDMLYEASDTLRSIAAKSAEGVTRGD